MLFIDVKYASMLAPRLRNFKRKNQYLWNFSCPVCGDSKTDKTKSRGYIYRKETDLFVKCHNCGYGSNIGNLIKYLDEKMYKDYVIERYKEGAVRYNDHKEIEEFVNNTTPVEIPEKDSVLENLICVTDLPDEHYAKQYVINRQIPKDKWKLLYFTDCFKTYTNDVFTEILKREEKFQVPVKNDHARLIIPYFNTHGKVFAYQGRAFEDIEPKYFTIKFDDDGDKIYGLDRVDYSKRIYCVEGPIDTLFIPNFIAASGSTTLNSATIQQIQTNCTIVLDNEPRNRDIVKMNEKYVNLGYSVALLPDYITHKDINDMILSGMTPDEIKTLIDQNTFKGAAALMRLATWKKI